MHRLAIAMSLLLAAASARGADIYVDNVQGDDRNNGSVPLPSAGVGGPTASIAKALRISQKGDRIIVANTGVPYRESITLQGRDNSGWPSAALVIQGNGAVLDGTAPVPVDAWAHVLKDVYCFAPVYKSYHQLYLDDRPAQRVPITSIDELHQLTPLTWALVDGQIFFCTEKDRGPGSYRLSFTARRTGITLYQVRHVQIVDLTVQGFQLDGINVHSNCYETELREITARGNGRSGISVGGASRVTIGQSLLGDNGSAQLRGEGFSTTTVEQTSLLENTAPALFREEATIVIDGQLFTGASVPQAAGPQAPASAGAATDDPSSET